MSLDTGRRLPSWMVPQRAMVRPVGLGISRRTSELCWAGALGLLTLGAQGGRLRRGYRQGRHGNSRVLEELFPAGLAGASRGMVVFLLQPPWEVTTLVKLLRVVIRLGYAFRLIRLNSIFRNDRLNVFSSWVRMLYTILHKGTRFSQASIDSLYSLSVMKELSRRPSKKGNGLLMA